MWSFLFVKRFSYGLLFVFSCAAISGCSTNSAMRLHVNSNGTFTDSKQNLVWQQDRSGVIISPEEATHYVENLYLADKNDWRLPTLAEFHNLYFAFDFGKKNQKKASFKLSGDFWVQDNDGNVIVGSWDDTGQGCCIIREFIPYMKGYVKAVRVVDTSK